MTNTRGALLLGTLVSVLGGVAMFSLPGDGTGPSLRGASSSSASGLVASGDSSVDPPPDASLVQAPQPLPHDSEVTIELAVIAPGAGARLSAAAAAAADRWPLAASDCGSDCPAVRKFLAEANHATLEVMAAADWILPPRSAIATVAPSVPVAERDALYEAKEVLVLRVQGEDTVDHLPARGAFALASALARDLHGYVHDEETRRIEPASVFVARAARGPLGVPFFVPQSLVAMLHPVDEEDVAGPYRVFSLGMSRFGAPDLEVRGFHRADGARLGLLLDAVAAKLVMGERGPRFTVTLDEVGRVVGRKPSELSRHPEASKPVSVTLVPSDRTAGDPDNDVYRILPPGDPDEEGHSKLLGTLFGEEERVLSEGTSDPALLAAEARARKAAPAAVARWKKDGGSLLLRVPFPIPGSPGKSETMWVRVKSCEASSCVGSLASRPLFVKNLEPGSEVTARPSDVSDYLLELPDGSKEGGETIPLLERAGTRPP